jgi:DNA repair protein RecO (recombination protein O)
VIEWRDEGLVLTVRPHGESAAILELLTAAHGRHVGVVRGGRSRKMAPLLQPGNRLSALWKARLESHMGTYSVELIRARAGDVMGDPLRLAALTAVCSLGAFILPEREAVAAFHDQTEALVAAIASGEGWLNDYVWWELAVLDVSGLRLDLSSCAAGGAGPLVYVSPKSGRAVSAEGAGEWADRLLPLPAMLTGGEATLKDVRSALDLTGYFLQHRLAPSLGDKPIPPARDRFLEELRRA